jgi:hypothetical protein
MGGSLFVPNERAPRETFLIANPVVIVGSNLSDLEIIITILLCGLKCSRYA